MLLFFDKLDFDNEAQYFQNIPQMRFFGMQIHVPSGNPGRSLLSRFSPKSGKSTPEKQ
jgi:hypothetical protein